MRGLLLHHVFLTFCPLLLSTRFFNILHRYGSASRLQRCFIGSFFLCDSLRICRFIVCLCSSAHLSSRGSVITPGSALVFELELLKVLE